MTPRTMTPPVDDTPVDRRRWLVSTLGAAAFVALVALLATPGSGSAGGAIATVLLLWIEAGAIALAWMIGATGLGVLATGRLGSLALALGVAVMLWTSHALGALGLFAGRGGAGTAVAWAPVLAGGVVLLVHLRRGMEPGRWTGGPMPPTVLLVLPALAVIVAAACAPPGTLWRSEAHGFDVLSYHLQLPREWLEGGRIVPLAHNAYSWLPSFGEAAFTHLGAMRGPRAPGAFVAGPGLAVHSAQMLHAIVTLGAAVALGRAAQVLTAPGGPGGAWIGASSAAIVLGVPWVVVTGSSAYNEGFVLLLLAVAIGVAMDPTRGPARRGLICGVLIGAACGAKPTAFFMAGLPVGVLLVWHAPVRRWGAMLAGGCAAGVVMLAPWLVRNALEGGNPVFPYMTGLLGSAHWSGAEVARWSLGHHESAGAVERVGLLLGAQRGVLHPQWALFPLLATASGIVAVLSARTRATAWPLAVAMGVQVLCWLTVGHLQSRFLLAMVAPGVLLVALALDALRARSERVALGAGVLSASALALASVRGFLAENAGAPNAALIGGVAAITGAALAEPVPGLTPEAQREQWGIGGELPPVAFVNLALPGARVYLLGDSTPLYFAAPVRYHTTWDRSPLGDALDRHGGELGAALADLRGTGVTHVLVDLDEVERLTRDGWYDPRVTQDIARRIVEREGVLVRAWTGSGGPRALGSYLIELGATPPGSGR